MTNPLVSDGPEISGADYRIHVFEGRYDERRLGHVSKAVQDALIKVLKVPLDDFFQVIHVRTGSGTPFVPLSDVLRWNSILLEVAFISARPKETSPS